MASLSNYDYHQPGEERELRKGRSEACSLSCLKFSLYCYNILLLLFGLAGLSVGLWSLVDRGQFLSLLTTTIFQVSGIVILLSGSLVVTITLIGCCGISRESRNLILVYSGLLAITVLLQSTIGITAYIYRDQVRLKEGKLSSACQDFVYRSTRSWSPVSISPCLRSTECPPTMTPETP